MKGMACWFTVEGLNIERFVRKTAEAGIQLHRMKRAGKMLTALVNEAQLSKVQELADQGGWRFIKGRRNGLGKCLDAAQKRWGLLCALAACGALLIASMQLVWYVDVTGEPIYQADARRFLHESNVHALMWRKDVDLAHLRDTLEWRYPEVAWVDCGWRGTTLHIDLVQGIPEGKTVNLSGSGDIVAARGGVVESIITLAGTAAVQPGDAVMQGQVLIHGLERGKAEESIPVMARGVVMARVWDQVSVQMSMTEICTDYTGRENTTWQVKCPWFVLQRMAKQAFEQQDVTRNQYPLGGMIFPFVIERTTQKEAIITKHTRTMAEMEAEAGAAALRALHNKIGNHDELVDKWVDYCMIEDEVLCASAYGECLIDIAEPRRNTP